MNPLISYFHGRRRTRLGPLLVTGHCYPEGAMGRRHFVIGWRYSTNRPLRSRLDDVLHRLLPIVSPRSLKDVEIRAERRRYASALEEILEVSNTRVRCRLHGGEFGAEDGTCDCYVAIDADDKAKEIASRALVLAADREAPPC